MLYEKISLGKLKALSTGVAYVKPAKGVEAHMKAVKTSVAFGDHAGNAIKLPDGKKVPHRFSEEEITLGEAKNSEGDTEYTSFVSWKKAAKKINVDMWLDGDQDIAQAMVGTKPFKKGETKSIGEWDGEAGIIYKQKAMEAVDANKTADKADKKVVTSPKDKIEVEYETGSLKNNQVKRKIFDSEEDMQAFFDKNEIFVLLRVAKVNESSNAINRARVLAGMQPLSEG